jgi:selenocysteine-specific elongation factor
VLRTTAPLNTIGGGVITDPYAPRRARLWEPGLTPQQRLRYFVQEAGGEGVETATLPIRLGLSPSACRTLVDGAANELTVIGGRLVGRDVLTLLGTQLIGAVEAYHAENPLELGMQTQLLRSRLRAAPEVVDAVLQAQIARGNVASTSGAVSLNGWAPTLDSRTSTAAEVIMSRLAAAGAEPPSVEELSGELSRDITPVLRFLERRGDVVQVEQNRYYASSALKQLIDRLRLTMAGGVELSPSELREAIGLSRKFLIPLLEYSDRVGYTNRGLTGRVWRGT